MTDFHRRVMRNAGSLQSLVHLAKEMNEERGAPDNTAACIETLMAVLGYMCTLPIEDLKRENGRLQWVEKQAQRVDKETNKLMEKLDKLENLLERVKEAQEGVDSVYRDVIQRFKEISETGDNETAEALRDVIEGTVRDVMLDMNAIKMENTNENENLEAVQEDSFARLFEDSGLFPSSDFENRNNSPPSFIGSIMTGHIDVDLDVDLESQERNVINITDDE